MNIKEFLDMEAKMASSEKLSVKLDSTSHELIGHYLRAWRGRGDLSQVVRAINPDQNFTTVLNEVRRSIRQNLLDQALVLIESTPVTSELERIELELERCRCDLFKKNYQSVVEISEPLIKNPETPATTRMTLYQVRGIAKTYAGQMHSALEDLDLALTIASTLSTAPSAYGALTVKSQAYSCLKDQAKAEDCLRLARSILDNTIDIDLWLERMLSYLRAQVRFDLYFSSELEFLKTTTTARCIAEWLGAEVVVRLCEDDLAGRTSEPVFYSFLGGKYIPQLKILLTDLPKTVTCLEDSPQASHVIEILCQKDLSKGELFEAVWGYRYNEAIHNGHLRNTLSRIRKYLPEGTLVSDNTIVRLKK